MSKSQPFADNGIKLSKTSLSVGDQLEITYNGLLSESGADEIILYGGYGEEWKEKILIPMQKEDLTFTAKFKIGYEGELHFTFKDPADNWDNNSGSNYTINIGKTKSTIKTAKPEEAKATKTTKTPTVKKVAASTTPKKSKDSKSEPAKSVRKTTKKQKTDG